MREIGDAGFTQINRGFQPAGLHWLAEFFLDDPAQQMLPVGVAYLVVHRDMARLHFISVADQWRRRGVAKQLVEACRAKWPRLCTTSAMCEEGAALLRSCGLAYIEEG